MFQASLDYMRLEGTETVTIAVVIEIYIFVFSVVFLFLRRSPIRIYVFHGLEKGLF